MEPLSTKKQILSLARPHHHLNSQDSAKPKLGLKTGTSKMRAWRGKTYTVTNRVSGFLMMLCGKHPFGLGITNHQTCVVNWIRALI